MMTALKFLYTDKSNLTQLGELLHRYGDTYAHTRLDNLPTESLRDGLSAKEKADEHAKAWKNQSGTEINSAIPPWIKSLNQVIANYGYNFLSDISLQNKVIGMTLASYFHDIYLNQPSDKFVMYGNKFATTEHIFLDGSTPDYIFVRPKWYLTYVQNLAALLAYKYELDISKLEMNVFNKMVTFATANECSLKGIIDYEISNKRGEDYFYIPVFYANPLKTAARIDAARSDYLQKAKEALEFTKKYMKEQGVNSIGTNEINENRKTKSYLILYQK